MTGKRGKPKSGQPDWLCFGRSDEEIAGAADEYETYVAANPECELVKTLKPIARRFRTELRRRKRVKAA